MVVDDFHVMGIAILLTTEFGVLDSASRISSDIVKVNWLRDNPRWTESKLFPALNVLGKITSPRSNSTAAQ